MLKDKLIDVITFTSSSTVKNFIESIKGHSIDELLSGVALASIGPITTKTATELGLDVSVTAEEYTIPGLVKAMTNLN